MAVGRAWVRAALKAVMAVMAVMAVAMAVKAMKRVREGAMIRTKAPRATTRTTQVLDGGHAEAAPM